MPKQQPPPADAIWEKIINLISETIRDAVKQLPRQSGDLLNFLGDLIAVGALLFLWWKNMLPQNQVLLSVGMLMVFMLLCFLGTFVMRRFRAAPSSR
jgi:hypothetical protein